MKGSLEKALRGLVYFLPLFFALALVESCGGGSEKPAATEDGDSNDTGKTENNKIECLTNPDCVGESFCVNFNCVKPPEMADGGSCSCADDFYSPVCGTDDKTYPNECTARCYGVSVKQTGFCPNAPKGAEEAAEDAGLLNDASASSDAEGGSESKDSDGDGIPDNVEIGPNPDKPWDNDGDKTPDYLDDDSDNDGIPDSVEAGHDPTHPVDTDSDAIPDYLDTDSDGDGIPDSIESGDDPAHPVDSDGDGIPDYIDYDSDNDNISDRSEAGPDPANPRDSDLDTIPDYRDEDSDGDGRTDAFEGTGDLDADGVPNYLDDDSDGDGIPDYEDSDYDGDGIPDNSDIDANGNGIPDSAEGLPSADAGVDGGSEGEEDGGVSHLTPNGEPCDDNTQCRSGNCVDGLCCNTSCDGICMSCNLVGNEGKCTVIADGQDPNNECAGDHAVCGGVCDGAGHCRYPASSTTCGSDICESETGRKTFYCSGQGNCESETFSCVPYKCVNNACKTACTSDSDCSSGAFCISGKCTVSELLENGKACSTNAICKSGYCVDGVCCNSACTAGCEACDLNGSVGTCKQIPAGQDPDNECGNPTCDGSCNGTGACDFNASNNKLCGTCQICDSGQCKNASNYTNPQNTCGNGACAGMCDGQGHCNNYPNGTRCDVCKKCNGSGSCSVFVPANEDPFNDCPNGPTNGDGCDTACNGQGGCTSTAGILCGAQDGCQKCSNFECMPVSNGLSCGGANQQCCNSKCCETSKPYCSSNQCVQCRNDNDCPICKVCNSGTCAPATAGTDPKGDCDGATKDSCDAKCNGSGACDTSSNSSKCGDGNHGECWSCNNYDCAVKDANLQCNSNMCYLCGANGLCQSAAPKDTCCSTLIGIGCSCDGAGTCKDCASPATCENQGNGYCYCNSCIQPNPDRCGSDSKCCCGCQGNECKLKCEEFTGSGCCSVSNGTPVCCESGIVVISHCTAICGASQKCCDSSGQGNWKCTDGVTCR